MISLKVQTAFMVSIFNVLMGDKSRKISTNYVKIFQSNWSSIYDVITIGGLMKDFVLENQVFHIKRYSNVRYGSN